MQRLLEYTSSCSMKKISEWCPIILPDLIFNPNVDHLIVLVFCFPTLIYSFSIIIFIVLIKIHLSFIQERLSVFVRFSFRAKASHFDCLSTRFHRSIELIYLLYC